MFVESYEDSKEERETFLEMSCVGPSFALIMFSRSDVVVTSVSTIETLVTNYVTLSICPV